MAFSENKVYLKGRAGRDAVTKHTSTGKSVTSFSLATGGGKSKDGTKEYPTRWHNITAWNNEEAQSVKKGALVEVTGRIEYEEYEKDGQKRNYTKIIANSVGFPDEKANPVKQKPITDEDLPF